jgi:hypothetical protein
MAQLRKTSEGQAEVTSKAHALPPRARSLLIMIDGKRSMDDLRAMLGPQVDEAAELLLREGLVERVEKVERSGSSSAPVPLDAAPSRPAPLTSAPVPLASAPVPLESRPMPLPEPAVDWQQLRVEAARAVTAAMGPMGDDLSLRIERCKNEEDLRAALRRAADLLDIAASRDQAAAFRGRFVSPG